MAFTEKKAGAGQAPFAEVQVLGKDRPLQGRMPVEPGNAAVGGLAVWNGLLVVSATCDDELVLIDLKVGNAADGAAAKAEKKRKKADDAAGLGEELGSVPLPQPTGMTFNADGDLFVISAGKLLCFPGAGKTLRERRLPTAKVLVADGLDRPTDVSLDGAGNLYISDRGASHQVKVFSASGQPTATLGKAGGLRLGAYDPQRMFNPAQVAVTDTGEVWVTESQFTPRRISRWKTDGRFVGAFYGPPGYGGGGRIMPDGQSVIYCHGDPWQAQATLEFSIDWATGSWTPKAVRHWLDAPGSTDLRLPGGSGPVNPLVINGRRYFHNASYLQGGIAELGIWMERDGKIVPVAAIGQPAGWKKTLLSDEFRGKLPDGVDPEGKFGGGPGFAWADLNADGVVQHTEVRWYRPPEARGPKKMSGFTVQDGLVLLTTDGKRLEPIEFTAAGVPVFDLNVHRPWVTSPEGTRNFGMVQLAKDGTVMQFGVPIVGWKNGERVWTYPCQYQGVHGSHASPKPTAGGEISGAMKNPGPLFTPVGGEAGQMWALTSNWGCMHLGTVDGLYVATVMRDARVAGGWPATVKRGDNVNEYTNGQESFGVTLQQLDDGRIILSVGGEMIGLCRLEGLETVRRLPTQTLSVTSTQLEAALAHQQTLAAAQRPKQDVLEVPVDANRREVRADPNDWKDAKWATIETERVPVNFGTKPMELKAALRVQGDRLHVAWLVRAGASLVSNRVENPIMLFKTGAALDLMLGAEGADPTRKAPVVGDQRLLIARAPGKGGDVVAMLYRQKSASPGAKQSFSSPWRSVDFDDVRNVSKLIEFRESAPLKATPVEARLYEVAIPLRELGLTVSAGTTIRGDVGFLRGVPGQTSERVYWCNKGSGLTADVPGEATLDPASWGSFRFAR